MSLQVRTERALQACYDALIMPDRWPTALQQLADALDVSSCTFASIGDRPTNPRSRPAITSLSHFGVAIATTLRVRIPGKRCPSSRTM
jgi:hypothetical protein